MQQLIQLLVGGLVVFVAAIWSLPSFRRMQTAHRQQRIERANRARALRLGTQATSRARARDLAEDLDRADQILPRPASELALVNGVCGPRAEVKLVELALPAVERPAVPELAVRLPQRLVAPEPVDIASLFDPDAPVDPDLIEGELVGSAELLGDDEPSDDDVIDAVIIEDPAECNDEVLRDGLLGIVPARQPGASLAPIHDLEIDATLLAELLGPVTGNPTPIDGLTAPSPSVRNDLHDVWGNHGSDHDVLVRALHALSELD